MYIKSNPLFTSLTIHVIVYAQACLGLSVKIRIVLVVTGSVFISTEEPCHS